MYLPWAWLKFVAAVAEHATCPLAGEVSQGRDTSQAANPAVTACEATVPKKVGAEAAYLQGKQKLKRTQHANDAV